MKNYLILQFCFVFWIPGIACDCKTIDDLKQEQKSSFEQHSLIFIGKTTAISSDGSYKLKIIELIKGNIEDSTIIGGITIDYCSRFPNEIGEVWLVYTDKYSDGTINIPDCGLSRSYRFPFYPGSDYLPPPPPRLTYDDESMKRLNNKINALEMYKRALVELRSEIEQLRKWK